MSALGFVALGDRQTGRTSAGITWLLRGIDRRVVIVANARDRERFASALLTVAETLTEDTRRRLGVPVALTTGWAQRRVITAQTVAEDMRGRRQVEFWIDDLEEVLHLLLHLGAAGTITGFGAHVPGIAELVLLGSEAGQDALPL